MALSISTNFISRRIFCFETGLNLNNSLIYVGKFDQFRFNDYFVVICLSRNAWLKFLILYFKTCGYENVSACVKICADYFCILN